jgi:hypothetical protein
MKNSSIPHQKPMTESPEKLLKKILYGIIIFINKFVRYTKELFPFQCKIYETAGLVINYCLHYIGRI